MLISTVVHANQSEDNSVDASPHLCDIYWCSSFFLSLLVPRNIIFIMEPNQLEIWIRNYCLHTLVKLNGTFIAWLIKKYTLNFIDKLDWLSDRVFRPASRAWRCTVHPALWSAAFTRSGVSAPLSPDGSPSGTLAVTLFLGSKAPPVPAAVAVTWISRWLGAVSSLPLYILFTCNMKTGKSGNRNLFL